MEAGSALSQAPTRVGVQWERLLVGGREFLASYATLSADPDSMLARLIRIEQPSQPTASFPAVLGLRVDRDADGRVLIDCDADFFAPVLNFLRLGELLIPPRVSWRGVYATARYLNVLSMMEAMDKVTARQRRVTRRQRVHAWGSGIHGELGTMERNDVAIPCEVSVSPRRETIRTIAVGCDFTCVLTHEGSVFSFGIADWGQLGLPPVCIPHCIPATASLPTSRADAAVNASPMMPSAAAALPPTPTSGDGSSYFHATATTEDAATFGYPLGRPTTPRPLLGQPSHHDSTTPPPATPPAAAARPVGGHSIAAGTAACVVIPTEVPGLRQSALAAGREAAEATEAIAASRMGGDGSPRPSIVAVAAGYAYGMAIASDCSVFFWGNNNHGQSALGPAFFGNAFRKVDEPRRVPALSGKEVDVVQLGCGSFFATALTRRGDVLAWGLLHCTGLGPPEDFVRSLDAAEGGLIADALSRDRRPVLLLPRRVRFPTESGRAVPRMVKIAAGQWHASAVSAHPEAALYTWGVGFQGRLGHGNSDAGYAPRRVAGLEGHGAVVDVACGSFHTVVLLEDGSVRCFGDNSNGQCGVPAVTTASFSSPLSAPMTALGLEGSSVPSPVAVPALRLVGGGKVTSIACGRQHTAVVVSGPHPWCTRPCCRPTISTRDAVSDGDDSVDYGDHGQLYVFGEVPRLPHASSPSPPRTTSVAGGVGGLRLVEELMGYHVTGIVCGPHHAFTITEDLTMQS